MPRWSVVGSRGGFTGAVTAHGLLLAAASLAACAPAPQVEPVPPLALPPILSAQIEAGSLHLSWQPNGPSSEVRVLRRHPEDATWELVAELPATTTEFEASWSLVRQWQDVFVVEVWVSVALSAKGDVLALGYTAAYVKGTGHACAREQVGNVWFDRGCVAGPTGRPGFGSRVAVSADGRTIAVSDPYGLHGGGLVGPEGDRTVDPGTGAVWVLTRSANGDVSRDDITVVRSPDPGIGDQFGAAIALSHDGSELAVGMPVEAAYDGKPTTHGAVYVY